MKPDAPATSRNREAILTVLKDEFRDATAVLEIGSGTGQHAVFFGRELPHLVWQTSDRQENHAGITAWLEHGAIANVKPPLDVDVLDVDSVNGLFDAVFSANTAHIMGIDAVRCMFRLVGDTLPAGAPFCLYGPFNIDGRYSSESNEMFDRSLKSQDPAMGIRDLAFLNELATDNSLDPARQYAMPANNMIVTWQKRP